MIPGGREEYVPRHRADTIPLGVDLTTVTLEWGYEHDDGRECAFWNRERKWVTDTTGVWSECLRTDHPRRVPTFLHGPPLTGVDAAKEAVGGLHARPPYRPADPPPGFTRPTRDPKHW